jgi:hypothetical protein
MSKLPNDCICLFYFQVGWGGGGVVWGWLYLIDSLNFIFFWVPSMKNINLNILKNLMVKVCKIWCNDVYISILQCDIFWWKLIDRNFFNPIFNTTSLHQILQTFTIRFFKIFKFMFFMDGTQKKMKLSRKVITHPTFASFFVCEIKNN